VGIPTDSGSLGNVLMKWSKLAGGKVADVKVTHRVREFDRETFRKGVFAGSALNTDFDKVCNNSGLKTICSGPVPSLFTTLQPCPVPL
jgi:hypothetical protein